MVKPRTRSVELTPATVSRTPLPQPGPSDNKEGRGRLLVIAGSVQMPGAVILAATAGMRAGAGKLTVATGHSIAGLVAQSMPESRVISLKEHADGQFVRTVPAALKGGFDATLVGPGMIEGEASVDFVRALLTHTLLPAIVLDAAAMNVVSVTHKRALKNFSDVSARVALTPHAGELAQLLDISRESVEENPLAIVREAAERWGACVALKGSTTYIADPSGAVWRHSGGNTGLATSGSGDVLAGLIAALAARGASIEQALQWGVVLHAEAGNRLASRIGPLGYLAREIAGEVPWLMDQWCRRGGSRR